MAIERMGQIAPNWKPNSSARNGNPMNTTKTTAANPQDNTAFLRRMLFTTATPLSYEAQLCRPHGTLAWAHASADTKPFAEKTRIDLYGLLAAITIRKKERFRVGSSRCWKEPFLSSNLNGL